MAFSIYEVPVNLVAARLDHLIVEHLGLPSTGETDLDDWRDMLTRIRGVQDEVEIAVVGKYIELHDAYKSIYESLSHAGIANACKVKLRKISAEQIADEGPDKLLAGVDGILVPGGFGERGFEGKIASIRYARQHKIPFLGICYGMQAAVVEFARSDLGITDATTTEYEPEARNPVISLMAEQKQQQDLGGTMRLGAFDCELKAGTHSHRAYGTTAISERHRHRFEFNNAYRERFEKAGFILAGTNPKLGLVEVVEVPDHPWFVGVQYHPEFKTQPLKAHPLFRDFVHAAIEHGSKR